MNVKIQAPWAVNEYLRNTIETKLEKLETYSDEIIKTDVFLKMKEHSGSDDKIVEIRVSIPGPYLFAEGQADTYEKAVTNAVEKIRRKLVKRKEKLANR